VVDAGDRGICGVVGGGRGLGGYLGWGGEGEERTESCQRAGSKHDGL
jgi:hypothetical protein